ncbi:oligopeptide transport system permease protein OppB [Acetivibrio straminisolvens JCM 21531]|uniref:Oligopeptide transport system permease protein OppB n=1 Tax=Acetivibrio straminisolvens JCM 21531 TaxID=1294263 RepID=W4V7W9_9FIRM|nr:ABC transporter permease subunit [Acetivibrio straminisolvens]GAE89460.1 oligopeptide transport system permease protein OppB [Acetivibrio straminisolvens JCM 21531]
MIENIFSIPGLGQYFVSGVQDKDYTMVVGLSVFTVFVAVLANTVTDIIYAVADPRVRITSKK